MVVGHGRLGKDRHARRRRNEVGDETNAFDLDRHTELDAFGPSRVVDLVAERVAVRRKDQRMVGERRKRRRLRPDVEIGGDEPDESFVAEVLHHEARVGDRLGHDRARELAVGDLDRQSLGRAFGQAERERRGDPAHLLDERRDERTADGTDDAERGVTGLEPLQHREVLAERGELAADRRAPGRGRARRTPWAPRPAVPARGAARRAPIRAVGRGPTRSTARCATGRPRR